MADPPEVTILLLGDTEVGKTTFLSYVSPSVRRVNSFHAPLPRLMVCTLAFLFTA
jgi:hypothetical protein